MSIVTPSDVKLENALPVPPVLLCEANVEKLTIGRSSWNAADDVEFLGTLAYGL